jgi:hypothetical protein
MKFLVMFLMFSGQVALAQPGPALDRAEELLLQKKALEVERDRSVYVYEGKNVSKKKYDDVFYDCISKKYDGKILVQDKWENGKLLRLNHTNRPDNRSFEAEDVKGMLQMQEAAVVMGGGAILALIPAIGAIPVLAKQAAGALTGVSLASSYRDWVSDNSFTLKEASSKGVYSCIDRTEFIKMDKLAARYAEHKKTLSSFKSMMDAEGFEIGNSVK